MNPIHEIGFASLILLFFLTVPGALSALIALAFSWKRPRWAFHAANVTFVLNALVCVLAALITLKLHARVDEAIDSGGYGPIADIRQRYGADWHASARLTAFVGLAMSALPVGLAFLVHELVRRKNPETERPVGPMLILGIAAFICLLMALF